MAGWLAACASFVAPVFIVLSPILSYGDQALSMHRRKSSAGFSLDITLIMLVASIFRIFYWHGAHFDTSLLLQSLVMVATHLILLKIALDHRPPPSSKGGDSALPFSGTGRGNEGIFSGPRPHNFWQWRSPKPYWQFLVYLAGGLLVLEVIMAPLPSLYALYSAMLGYVGLGVEATLAIPLVLTNLQTRSCKGFRLSVLVAWLAGDTMKMYWFFTATTHIPAAFKACGLFQAACDCVLGVQYMMYSDGERASEEHQMDEGQWSSAYTVGGRRPHSWSFSQARPQAMYSDSEVD